MTNQTRNHFRLLYAVIVVLFACLLVTAGQYSRLKQECAARVERLDDFTLRTMRENVRLDSEIAQERWAVRDAFARLSEWEAAFPARAEAFRQRAIEGGVLVPTGKPERSRPGPR